MSANIKYMNASRQKRAEGYTEEVVVMYDVNGEPIHTYDSLAEEARQETIGGLELFYGSEANKEFQTRGFKESEGRTRYVLSLEAKSYDPDTGEKVTNPFIQFFTPKEFDEVQKRGLNGYTVEVLNNPFAFCKMLKEGKLKAYDN